MASKNKTQKNETPKKETKINLCGECQRCVPVMRFNTLSIKGKPTLGECPLVHDRRVLLSERACKHFLAESVSKEE